jgi:starvation-inducible DNA-binding protein
MQNRTLYTGILLLCVVHIIGQQSNVIIKGGASNSEQLVNIGLDDAARQDIALRLNKLLSDEYVLYVKTQKYHWNVTGPFFGPLHKLFNDQYDMLAEFVDEVAERVRALGFKAYGTMAEFIEHTSLSEDMGVDPEANLMIKNLLDDHETVIRELRDYIDYTHDRKDLGTENFLAELIVKHQKMAWMLRAHLLG